MSILFKNLHTENHRTQQKDIIVWEHNTIKNALDEPYHYL
jgi:hypothetical protein